MFADSDMKLYYDDPLHAAIMARDFGVTYARPDDCRMTMQWADYHSDAKNVSDFEEHDKLYIHPDSYSIFEPQEGDMVYTKNDSGSESVCWVYGDTEKLQREIIQRNGKAFFMPKEQEDD